MKKHIKKWLMLGLAVMVFVSGGMTGVVAATQQYKDIPTNFWAYDVITWATEQNIVKGYPDGRFGPEDHVTEQQFLAMLIRAYRGEMLDEPDSERWADPYYEVAEEMNYPVTGIDDLNKRYGVILRERVAEIIAGTQGVNYKGRDAIQYLLGKGLAVGRDPANISIDNFAGGEPLTRAQTVKFIKNVMEKGIKDENGNPIMLPMPEEPSDPKDLPPLPGGNDGEFDWEDFWKEHGKDGSDSITEGGSFSAMDENGVIWSVWAIGGTLENTKKIDQVIQEVNEGKIKKRGRHSDLDALLKRLDELGLEYVVEKAMGY